MKIQVKITHPFGQERINPKCENASYFCKLLNQKSLTRNNIDYIKALGFEVEVVQEVVSL
jgi:hypothetical protein